MSEESPEKRARRYLAFLLSLRKVNEAERALQAFTQTGTLSPTGASFYKALIQSAQADQKKDAIKPAA